jgi:hypothetical protein
MTPIEELRDVIHKLHGGTATHVESVPVKETFQGRTVWDGMVEVFDLHGHPKTHRAYAWWHYGEGDEKRYVTVLHIPPAVSPVTAVQTAIVQEYQSRATSQA